MVKSMKTPPFYWCICTTNSADFVVIRFAVKNIERVVAPKIFRRNWKWYQSLLPNLNRGQYFAKSPGVEKILSDQGRNKTTVSTLKITYFCFLRNEANIEGMDFPKVAIFISESTLSPASIFFVHIFQPHRNCIFFFIIFLSSFLLYHFDFYLYFFSSFSRFLSFDYSILHTTLGGYY